ncbi:hypothetical protein EVAR_86818_1 [Eumeta japonica]|uniref:Uncharacterized protein n=1 Tax=Eumeta variegata TaxID=151549 RepID=A0A4C1VRX2_EUMVA|nr:hypothetical protein EVAR_86818_1 [Eumeta japonica]
MITYFINCRPPDPYPRDRQRMYLERLRVHMGYSGHLIFSGSQTRFAPRIPFVSGFIQIGTMTGNANRNLKQDKHRHRKPDQKLDQNRENRIETEKAWFCSHMQSKGFGDLQTKAPRD